jgi:dienelactone hydrolase
MKSLSNVSLVALLTLAAASVPRLASPAAAAQDDAAAFGAREAILSASLSADGKHLVIVRPAEGPDTVAVTVDLAHAQAKQVARATGEQRLTDCEWTAADLVTCRLYGITHPSGISSASNLLIPYTSWLSINVDSGKQLPLGPRNRIDQQQAEFGGDVLDWMNGVDGKVLMARDYTPEESTGHLASNTAQGMGVDLIDTRNGKTTPVEHPAGNAEAYLADGHGNVRVEVSSIPVGDGEYASGRHKVSYRTPGDPIWHELGTYATDAQGNLQGMEPLAVDPQLNAVYVLQKLNGRDALSAKSELVFANADVDVDGVEVIGRSGRVVGADYTTDRGRIEYFDPTYKQIHLTLAHALPNLPLIDIISASADEQTLLVSASSDVDPGHYYVYDRAHSALTEIMASRPELQGKTLSPMQTIHYPAADGTQIPAYLTLPPGVTDPKGLPAIVMPHGGPAARDTWGFDWLAQFFAQRGYAVLQPNYRGSAGYGENWYQKNGFQSWKTAVGDICDAGRWLVAQHVAAADKLAIVGWSYGGYAALQSNVLDPDLFKAVVAIAPITDLGLLRNQALHYSSGTLERDFIGDGPHLKEGSPAQNAAAFKAPVLMFQGDLDLNVDIAQSRRMDAALHSAGKASQLVVYPGLEHSLRDGNVRADMLRKADAFLRKQLGLESP